MSKPFVLREGVFYIDGVEQPWRCSNVTGTSFCEHPTTGGKFQIFAVEVDTPTGSRHAISIGGRPPRGDEFFHHAPDVMRMKATEEGILIPVAGQEFMISWPQEG